MIKKITRLGFVLTQDLLMKKSNQITNVHRELQTYCRNSKVKFFFSTTDMNSGYWQIPLDEDSKQYTAFLFYGHLYEFNRIPFGLKTAGSGFIRALSIALGQELEEFISCYIDDILIASRSFVEHLEHIEKLLIKLEQAGFTLSLKKSKFFREEVSFLGFKLSAEGIRADPERLSVISDFPCPKDKR